MIDSPHAAALSFYLTDRPFAMCHAYGTERTPILALNDEHASLVIASRSSLPAADQLQFARQLLVAVTEYVAAVETYTAAEPTTATRH